MMLQLNFISGFMLGFEVIYKGLIDEFTYIVVDLFIVRFTFSWE